MKLYKQLKKTVYRTINRQGGNDKDCEIQG